MRASAIFFITRPVFMDQKDLKSCTNILNFKQAIVDKAFGPGFPSLKEITRNVSLLFTNANELFELPHPISNKIIYIGGIVTSTPKPLDEVICTV